LRALEDYRTLPVLFSGTSGAHIVGKMWLIPEVTGVTQISWEHCGLSRSMVDYASSLAVYGEDSTLPTCLSFVITGVYGGIGTWWGDGDRSGDLWKD